MLTQVVEGTSNTKIFILGDSRTGTMSLHNYLKRQGIASVHHYVAAARQNEPDHLHHQKNWIEFQNFISTCNYTAFSDYPTRSFYRELHREFPDAFFILTVRKSVEVWQSSMKTFFEKFGIALDLEGLTNSYTTVNQEIRKLYQNESRKFLEICIDDDNIYNSQRLSQFLNANPSIKLSHQNKTVSYETSILSKRRSIFGAIDGNIIDYVEKTCGTSKAMLSETGWLYLINDTNDFLKVQYGHVNWSDCDCARTLDVLRERSTRLNELGVQYAKFIIPEKSIVYSENLPKIFSEMSISRQRPSVFLAENYSDEVFYLENFLKDAKSYGTLYFRGDTHPNWLGSFFIYRYIAEYLVRQRFLSGQDLLRYSDLVPVPAQYDGDLFAQLDPEQKSILIDVWGHLIGQYGFECLLCYQLSTDKKQAVRLETPQRYKDWFTTRETLVYENQGSKLPTAVIFRDSTADFLHELLAQHFSRSVFVWHQGQIISNVIHEEQPDIVLHIMAERFIIRYPSWKAFHLLPQN